MNSFLDALKFLTILSFPSKRSPEIIRIGRSGTYFPLVGLMLGGILVGANWLCSRLLPQEIASALLVLLLVILTRGIHLDGLADSADALLGGHDPKERLLIMKDSSIGAFGVIAIFFALLFKFLFLSSLPHQIINASLILMITLSRWSLVIMSFLGRSARPDGLGSIFTEHTGYVQLILATLFTLVIGFVFLGLSSVIPIIALLLFAIIVTAGVSRMTGGITGDTLGGFAELSEILCLAIIYVLTVIS